MLSFDEFTAANDRERAKQKLKQDIISAKGVEKSKSDVKDSSIGDAGRVRGVGDFLEMHQMQFAVIVLIFLDIFASFTEVYLDAVMHFKRSVNTNAPILIPYYYQSIVYNLAKSFTGFSVLFFTLEILAILAVFKFSTVGHFGYLIDSGVVTFQLYMDTKGAGKETRILNILRLWRVVRLFNSMVAVELERHEVTKRELEIKNASIATFELDVKSLKGEVVREKEARDSVELMLQGYKEEVDTLNEALKIAAMDIAEVAEADDDYLLSDDEDGEDGETDVFMDAASSDFDRTKKKELLYREARKDADSVRSSASQRSQGVTFVVREDGSFHKR